MHKSGRDPNAKASIRRSKTHACVVGGRGVGDGATCVACAPCRARWCGPKKNIVGVYAEGHGTLDPDLALKTPPRFSPKNVTAHVSRRARMAHGAPRGRRAQCTRGCTRVGGGIETIGPWRRRWSQRLDGAGVQSAPSHVPSRRGPPPARAATSTAPQRPNAVRGVSSNSYAAARHGVHGNSRCHRHSLWYTPKRRARSAMLGAWDRRLGEGSSSSPQQPAQPTSAWQVPLARELGASSCRASSCVRALSMIGAQMLLRNRL